MFDKLKIKIRNYRLAKKYNVGFGKNASANKKTIFEGMNFLNTNAVVYDSYVGMGTYISGNSKLVKAKIGRFCSIGQNVKNGFGMHPAEGFVSTHPAFFSLNKQAGFTLVSRQKFKEHKFVDTDERYYIAIGNDVWIGNDVNILDGVTIGDGAIIGSGALVTKNIEPYTIAGGIPAKKIRMRFSDEEIEKLLRIKWWEKDIDWIKNNAEEFENIKGFLENRHE